MRVLRFVVPATVAVSLAAAASFVACSSDNGPAASFPAYEGGPGDTGATTFRPDTSTEDSGEQPDTATAEDAATSDALNQVDANDVPDGGSAVDPGHVQCGASSCAVPADQCCAQVDGGGSCVASNGSCPSGTGTLKCDEAANCTQGTVCCAVASFTGVSASCTATCAGLGQYQLCRTNGECPNKDCTPQTCFGVRLEACGGVQTGCTK